MNPFKGMWRTLFGPAPKQGDIFTFDEKDGDPFTKPLKVEVLEVKDGWVLYRYCDTTLYQRNTMTFSQFRYCYK